ncbi:MAG: GNAT family N-acetyltransferase [Clostridia bacterium]|nr:GNAT family N-acetyltransferase [Clostridia bacterium]
MEIRKIEYDKERYLSLLLEADPEKEAIDKYLDKGEMYIIEEDGDAVCEVVVTEVDNDTCELKNIATLPKVRGKGYASKIIQYIFEVYKNKYKRMIVGTTENMIPFYVLNGFTKYHHTVKNFFIDNYNEEIWDGDLHCIDMYYYSKEFK